MSDEWEGGAIVLLKYTQTRVSSLCLLAVDGDIYITKALMGWLTGRRWRDLSSFSCILMREWCTGCVAIDLVALPPSSHPPTRRTPHPRRTPPPSHPFLDEVFGAVQEVTGDIFISDNRRLNDVSALFKVGCYRCVLDLI